MDKHVNGVNLSAILRAGAEAQGAIRASIPCVGSSFEQEVRASLDALGIVIPDLSNAGRSLVLGMERRMQETPVRMALRQVARFLRMAKAASRKVRSASLADAIANLREGHALAVDAFSQDSNPGQENIPGVSTEDKAWVLSFCGDMIRLVLGLVEDGLERSVYRQDRQSSVGACAKTRTPRRMDGKYGNKRQKRMLPRQVEHALPGSAVVDSQDRNPGLNPLAHQVASSDSENIPGERVVVRRYGRAGRGIHSLGHVRLAAPVPVANAVRTGCLPVVPVEGDGSRLPFGGAKGHASNVVERDQMHVPECPRHLTMAHQGRAASRLPVGMAFLRH